MVTTYKEKYYVKKWKTLYELNFRQFLMNVCSLQTMDVHTNTKRTSLKENAAHNECRCHALVMGNRTEHLNRIFVKEHNSQKKIESNIIFPSQGFLIRTLLINGACESETHDSGRW